MIKLNISDINKDIKASYEGDSIDILYDSCYKEGDVISVKCDSDFVSVSFDKSQKESIIYVCLNQVVIIVVRKTTQMLNMSVYLSSVFILVISMSCLWIISKIIVNTKLKRMIGK